MPVLHALQAGYMTYRCKNFLFLENFPLCGPLSFQIFSAHQLHFPYPIENVGFDLLTGHEIMVLVPFLHTYCMSYFHLYVIGYKGTGEKIMRHGFMDL